MVYYESVFQKQSGKSCSEIGQTINPMADLKDKMASLTADPNAVVSDEDIKQMVSAF